MSTEFEATTQALLTQLIQTISNFAEESHQQQRRLEESLQTTSDQVGRLTEGLTEMRVAIQEQSEIAKQQAENITRLVSVVDRQAVMVERLMDNQTI